MNTKRLPAIGLSTLAVCAAALTGCIQIGEGGAAPAFQRHAIDPRPAPPVEVAPETGLIGIALREFSAPERYDLAVVTRDAGGEVLLAPYDRWLEAPGPALTAAVRESLAEAGAFAWVEDAAAGFRADVILEGHLVRCDVEELAGGGRELVVRVRLTGAATGGDPVLFSIAPEARRRLDGPGLDGLGAAASECAGEIAGAVLARFQGTGAASR